MRKLPERALVPAAALASSESGLVQTLDRAAGPINDYEKALGGRQSLIASLAIDSTPDIRNLVEMLLDPHYDGYSLWQLAQQGGVTLTDLFRAYRNTTLAKAQIRATKAVAERLVDVVEDVMKQATPYEVPCLVCSGTGTRVPKAKHPHPEPVSCKACDGRGQTTERPSVDRQRLALELGELIKVPKHGPTVLQQFNIPGAVSAAVGTTPGSLERMQQAVTDFLFSARPTAIEIAPVPESLAEDGAP